jgi:hypothetical protein
MLLHFKKYSYFSPTPSYILAFSVLIALWWPTEKAETCSSCFIYIYIINILLCLMGENRNVSWSNASAFRTEDETMKIVLCSVRGKNGLGIWKREMEHPRVLPSFIQIWKSACLPLSVHHPCLCYHISFLSYNWMPFKRFPYQNCVYILLHSYNRYRLYPSHRILLY